MLTKTNYITGLKCPKKMILDNDIKPVINFEIIDNANSFKKMVQSTFEDIFIIEGKSNINDDVKQTKIDLKNKNKYFGDATFKSSDMLSKIDILEKTKNGYNIYEVKSSTTEKEDYIHELAYQFYVTSHLIKINKIFLVQPKKISVDGVFNPKDMIVIKEKTEEVLTEVNKVAINSYFFKEALLEGIEDQPITANCKSNSILCPYLDDCIRDIPRDNIFHMSNIPFEKKIECYNNGIITKEDLLKHPEIKVKKQELLDTISINKKEIKEFLEKIEYPISYLDFETVSFLVPRYKVHTVNSKIVIQYSLHIKDKVLSHKYAIEKANTDPRRKIAESLVKDTPKTGSVIVYHKAFEASIIENLSEMYEDLKNDLLSIRDRLVDLEIIFKNKYYYNPLFYGSSSIKVVLPTLFPNDEELNYKKFNHVHNGLEAASYLRQDDYSEEIKQDLLEYCKLDTLAMVKIHEFLKNII